MKRLSTLLILFLIMTAHMVNAQSIYAIISTSPDHNTLTTAIDAAGLDGTLMGDGPFTVLAPTDDAFNALPAGLLDDLLDDPEGALTEVLLYHVINDEVDADGLVNSQVAIMANGQTVNITTMNGDIFVNDVQVTVEDIPADNGIIHVLNGVLIPSFDDESFTVADVIAEEDDLSTLATAVDAAGLTETLEGDGPFTVFAPTNDAFNALPDGLLDDLLADPAGALTDILLYHVAGDSLGSADLSDEQEIITINGAAVTVTISNGDVFINDAQVLVADLTADNGVVHIIDAVLVPDDSPEIFSVFNIIEDSPDHNTLEQAIIAAGLVEALEAEGPFTVFAPTDDAFDALPDGVLDALLSDPQGALSEVLLYHVIGDNLGSSDLENDLELTTLNGETVLITIENSNVFINDAQVTVTDLLADNGVVHVIDAVLVPGDSPSDPTTVMDIIENADELSTLTVAINAAGLSGTLSGSGPFTVFAPVDNAFNALPPGLIDDLLADPDGALTAVLTYHVVGSSLSSGGLTDGQEIVTLNGQSVTISIENGDVFINDAQVIIADSTADNGIVHFIDAVLVPDLSTSTTVFDIINESPDHTTLATAIIAAELQETLEGDGPFTVFAPTDEAFGNLPDGVLDDLLTDPTGALADILLYHVIGDNLLSGDLSDGQTVETLNGESITITIEDDQVLINNALVTFADIEADNGVVHVIDAVLLPELDDPFTIMDIVRGSPIHETLNTAIEAAGLVETLEGDGPFTLFAPTDDAFDALPDGLLDELLDDPEGALTQVLLYHAVADIALSEDLEDEQIIVTINGQEVVITIENGDVFVNDAQVIVADLEADNGVVQVIDAVLVPEIVEPFTVMDIIEESEIHETLEAAINAAGLDDTLRGEGPFTVFAPTDEAFDALPDGLIDELLAEPEGLLTQILLYHVVADVALSTDLEDGMEIATLNGQSVLVTITDGDVFINGAQVIVADIEADNGVVHVIDAVLVPEVEPITVMDIIEGSDIHNTLATAINAAGLDDVLRGDGPFTVFAPTDDAFGALPPGVIDELLQDPEGLLTQILLYHVASGTVLSSDLEDGQIITTINGEDVVVTIENGDVFINDAQVIVADLIADNGVVHVIDAVLLPPAQPTVYGIIQGLDELSTLNDLLILTALNFTLDNEEETYTVFAPTNAAFDALGQELIDELLSDPFAELLQALRHHVVADNAVFSSDLSDGLTITSFNGQELNVTIEDGNVFINDAQVIIADLEASNGVVHVIDAVLIPEFVPCDIALDLYDTFITQFGGAPSPAPDGTCETFTLGFETWASEAYLISNFQEGVEYTFDICSGPGAGSWSPQISVVDLQGNFIQTVEDTCEITWVAEADGFYLIIINEVGACGSGSENNEVDNGFPRLTCQGEAITTVVDIIDDSNDHITLSAALQLSGLDNTLRGEGPFTVFAPTDAAFSALSEATTEAINSDEDLLNEVLLNHVVGALALSSDLEDGQVITTLNQEGVVVTITDTGVFINNAMVTVADLVADNGVVHVIDAVLLPAVVGTRDIVGAFEGVNIYPNPASETVFIDLQSVDRPIERVRLMDITGRTVDSYRLNPERTQINLTSLQTGTYFFEFMIENEIYHKKLIINR